MQSSYDIVFVIGYHRTANTILTLIQEFSVENRVGIIFYDAPEELRTKTEKNLNKLLKHLKQQSTLLEATKPFDTNLLIIQHFNYEDAFLSRLKEISSYKDDFIVMSFGSVGLHNYDSVVSKFDGATLLAQDSQLLHFLAKRRGVFLYNKRKILEIGFPIIKNSVVRHNSIDWLILAPTTFSLQSIEAKNAFLKAVIRFINNYKLDTFVYKSHNGNVRDSLVSIPIPVEIQNLIARTKIVNLLIKIVSLKIFYRKKFINKILNILLRLEFKKLTINLSDIEKNHYLAAENFIGSVNKGVLGGFSNTIWGAAYFDKKYFCLSSQNDYEEIYKNSKSRRTLGGNLEYLLDRPPENTGCELLLNSDIKSIQLKQKDVVKIITCRL